MWELYHKKGWTLKHWCFWTVVLEKTLGSPLDCKEIQPVHAKGNQSWIFIGRTDAETEALILWSSDAKSQLTGKDLGAGKGRRQEKGATEDEMVGWHHRLNGHEFGKTPGDTEGRRCLVCWGPWGHKELDMTLQLNNSNVSYISKKNDSCFLCVPWHENFGEPRFKDWALSIHNGEDCQWRSEEME